jgi:3-dehydroquinate dehydratase-1
MSDDTRKPSIVAVVASPEDLADPVLLSTSGVEFCELRIDLLHQYSIDLNELTEAIVVPKIVTVRDPIEGGAASLREDVRRALLRQWSPVSTYIDIELRNLNRFSHLIADAESAGKGIIVSFHDFNGTPRLEALQEQLEQSHITENRIFKVATRVSQWSDVVTLVDLLEKNRHLRIAAMGMGKLGKLSRVILARMGSCLIYGSLGKAVAPGQWPCMQLKEILTELWD